MALIKSLKLRPVFPCKEDIPNVPLRSWEGTVSLERLRVVFDVGGIGLILIGMPAYEKRLARLSAVYPRVGFIHEFRPLSTKETIRLLAVA